MANLKYESRLYRIRGITPLLGGLPANKEIYTKYIASRAPGAEDDPTILDTMNEEKGITVFARDRSDHICVLSRHIKGFFKESLGALKAQYDIGMYKGKVDTMLFVEPMFIPLIRNGDYIIDEDDMLERPLRADTPMGVRTALQSSEMINDPWEIEIEITLFPNNSTAKKSTLSWDAIEAALDYGAFHGIGQWRNADYGKFTWTRIEEE